MKRLQLFPAGTTIENGSLTIAGIQLPSLAEIHGTPLYVYDRATMDLKVGEYREALEAHYPAPHTITYAAKAFLCLDVAGWAHRHDLWIDCSGEGEIGIGAAAGVPRRNLLSHGVNKSIRDLASAIENVGTIVVDNLTEVNRIAQAFSTSMSTFPDLWLRLLPGVAVDTHHKHTQTGQPESKFGMTREEAMQAAGLCAQRGLPLKGLHFHQGSNFRDPEPLIPAIDMGLDLAREIGFKDEWHFCPGGGWGVAYHEDELPEPSIEEYVRGIAQTVIEGCQARGLALPHLHLEPGRSLIARAGVAIYQVGTVKRRANRTWLLIDGGMADNPRFALYGARYSCLPLTDPGREFLETVSIAGPYCESGDILLEDLPMPKMEPDEWIAIPVSGAYQLSMASNYNGARRPEVVWIEAGGARPIIRRETVRDLLHRDAGY